MYHPPNPLSPPTQSGSKSNVFIAPDLSFFQQLCLDVYPGVTFPAASGTTHSNVEYGGRTGVVDSVPQYLYVSNGVVDPWHILGITGNYKPVGDHQLYVSIVGCVWTYICICGGCRCSCCGNALHKIHRP